MLFSVPSKQGAAGAMQVFGCLLLVTLLSPLQQVQGFRQASNFVNLRQAKSRRNRSSNEACQDPQRKNDDRASQCPREESNALNPTSGAAHRALSRKQLANVLVGLGTAGAALLLHSQQTAEAAGEQASATTAAPSSSIELDTARDASSGILRRGLRRQAQAKSSANFKFGGELGLPLPAIGQRTKRVFLARHGQTELNALMVCQGRRLNPPLNEKGRGQARRLLTRTRLDAIVCSPLRRARETAGIVRGSHPGTSVSVAEELNEVDFGGAEGLPQPLAAAFLAPTYQAWSAGHWGKQAGRFGESGDQLRRRAAVMAETLLDSCDEGGQVLGVSHSSMIKFTLSTLLDVPLNTIRTLGQDNCAVNVLDFNTMSGVFNAVIINSRPMRGRAARFEGVS